MEVIGGRVVFGGIAPEAQAPRSSTIANIQIQVTSNSLFIGTLLRNCDFCQYAGQVIFAYLYEKRGKVLHTEAMVE